MGGLATPRAVERGEIRPGKERGDQIRGSGTPGEDRPGTPLTARQSDTTNKNRSEATGQDRGPSAYEKDMQHVGAMQKLARVHVYKSVAKCLSCNPEDK